MKPYIKMQVLGAQNAGKTTLTDALITKLITDGQTVQTAPDIAMTKEGRTLQQKIKELQNFAQSKNSPQKKEH